MDIIIVNIIMLVPVFCCDAVVIPFEDCANNVNSLERYHFVKKIMDTSFLLLKIQEV